MNKMAVCLMLLMNIMAMYGMEPGSAAGFKRPANPQDKAHVDFLVQSYNDEAQTPAVRALAREFLGKVRDCLLASDALVYRINEVLGDREVVASPIECRVPARPVLQRRRGSVRPFGDQDRRSNVAQTLPLHAAIRSNH